MAKTVLIADDNTYIRQALCEQFKRESDFRAGKLWEERGHEFSVSDHSGDVGHGFCVVWDGESRLEFGFCYLRMGTMALTTSACVGCD